MLKKYYFCCKKCSNGGFYFQVKNKTTFYIFFSIQYKLKNKNITKQSGIFGPGKKQHLLFPSDITNMIFTVFNASNNPPTIIGSLFILGNESICYDVSGNTLITQCTRIPC